MNKENMSVEAGLKSILLIATSHYKKCAAGGHALRADPEISDKIEEILQQQRAAAVAELMPLVRAAIRVDDINEIWERSGPGDWTSERAEECKAAHIDLHEKRLALPESIINKAKGE